MAIKMDLCEALCQQLCGEAPRWTHCGCWCCSPPIDSSPLLTFCSIDRTKSAEQLAKPLNMHFFLKILFIILVVMWFNFLDAHNKHTRSTSYSPAPTSSTLPVEWFISKPCWGCFAVTAPSCSAKKNSPLCLAFFWICPREVTSGLKCWPICCLVSLSTH